MTPDQAVLRQRKGSVSEPCRAGFGDGAPLHAVSEDLLAAPADGRPDEPSLLTATAASREPGATGSRD